MKRRDFITLLGSAAAAAWPIAARAQQPAMPVVGVLYSGSPEMLDTLIFAFRQGLSEMGYVEGRNVTLELRLAEGQYDRLPSLAADLVRRKVAVIFTAGGQNSAFAAKSNTTTIPIVFTTGGDPVSSGLIASLNRPGGNITGITNLTAELEPKRLEILNELVPTADVIAVLVNPAYQDVQLRVNEIEVATRAVGKQIHVLRASNEGAIDAAFAALVEARAGAILVSSDPFFFSRRHHIVALAAQYAVPAIYQWREFAQIGGLISYGARLESPAAARAPRAATPPPRRRAATRGVSFRASGGTEMPGAKAALMAFHIPMTERFGWSLRERPMSET